MLHSINGQIQPPIGRGEHWERFVTLSADTDLFDSMRIEIVRRRDRDRHRCRPFLAWINPMSQVPGIVG